ncbi:hypothetical protein [Lactiplantibacillus modestisalitolerans]|uniref:Uncharacterized protein n=1 Tax=Lactiplantibacillus modestisalitolerans TaxID=1457219 RepID=A0ABV5WRC1_9LACO|nr:hypothetical protein [Lactiplantibacillus modestisalitolerans]
MAQLPLGYDEANQLMGLENCLHAVGQTGFNGLKAVNENLVAELGHLLNAEITILRDAPRFILIIHNHREKLAILGHIHQQEDAHYNILLDGYPVNDGPALMAVLYKYL